nr:type I-E CRISPR-associated protein Cse1/CasA [Escherichia coli]MWL01746.1 type I-E CRISPR-associated protein Cse1/CasA [Escherichia coli]
LHGSVQGVTGVVLAQGDKMTPQNRQDLEAMSNWRYSNPQSKKFGVPTYMPQKHDADRSLWRALPAVLAPETITNVLNADSDAFIPGATLECAADHDSAATLRVQAVGITYGPKEATIEEVVNDSVDLRAAILGAESGQIRAMMQD